MKPHIPTAAVILILAAPLCGCASLRERLTPRSETVTRVIRSIEDYHGERPPTPRELGASGKAILIRNSRPVILGFRIDRDHSFRAVYPKGPPDEYSKRVIDAAVAGRKMPPEPKPVQGPNPLDEPMRVCGVITNSGRVISLRNFDDLIRLQEARESSAHSRDR